MCLLRFIFLILSSAWFVCSWAQDVRTVDIPPFKRVSVTSGIDLFLTPASKVGMTIRGEKHLISRVHCQMEGDHLTISMSGNFNWFSNKTIQVYLNYTEIDYLAASAGSDVRSDVLLSAPSLEVKGQSGADVFLLLDAQKLKVTLTSGSDARFKGSADELIANVTSGSELAAFDLKARKVTVDASGGADADVFATSELRANSTGGSDIRYKGSPAVKEVTSSGGGDVTSY